MEVAHDHGASVATSSAERGGGSTCGSSNPSGFESPREEIELDVSADGSKKSEAQPGGDRQAGDGEGPPESLSEYVDWAMGLAGGAGRYQNRVNFLMGAPWFIAGLQTLLFVFVTLPPHRRHHCTQHGQLCHYVPIEDSNCMVARSEYEYTNREDTVSAEWDLICETSLYVPLLSTIFFLGFLFGVYFFGACADSRGRRSAFLWSWIFTQAGAFAAVVSPSYRTYAVSRLITGFGVGGFGLVSYVWNAEFLGAERRSILVLTTNMFFALGCLVMPILSLALPPWRHSSSAAFLLGLPYLWTYRLCFESPKWLAGQGRAAEVHAVMCAIAMGNGRPEPPPPRAQESRGIAEARAASLRTGGEPRVVTKAASGAVSGENVFAQLCLDSRLALRFNIMCFTWFCLSLGYYGLSMNVSNLGSNVYLSSSLASLVELPAYMVAVRVVDSAAIGRRGSTGGGLIVGGVCCTLSAVVLDAPPFFMLVLVFVGKFAIALSFASVYLYAAELFPTSIRSRAMGIQSLASRVGGMLSSIVASWGQTSQALPLLIFGVPCLAAGALVVLLLPETRGQPMLATIEDLGPSKSSGRGMAVNLPVFKRPYAHLDEDRTPAGDVPVEKIGAAEPGSL